MKPFLILTASALAMTVSGLAFAQAAPEPRGGQYASERGDAPHAGRDHGGGGRGAMRALIRLGAADANGDKQVTRAELQASREAEFDFRDRNGDGHLDRGDASPTRQHLMQMREDAGEAGQRREGRRGDRRGRGMQAVDADGDGRISRVEMLNAPSPVFDALDANGDGVVTGEEIDAHIEARRQGREQRREAAVWWRD